MGWFSKDMKTELVLHMQGLVVSMAPHSACYMITVSTIWFIVRRPLVHVTPPSSLSPIRFCQSVAKCPQKKYTVFFFYAFVIFNFHLSLYLPANLFLSPAPAPVELTLSSNRDLYGGLKSSIHYNIRNKHRMNKTGQTNYPLQSKKSQPNTPKDRQYTSDLTQNKAMCI